MMPLAWPPTPVAAGTDERIRSESTSSPRAWSRSRRPPATAVEQEVVDGDPEGVPGPPQLVQRLPRRPRAAGPARHGAAGTSPTCGCAARRKRRASGRRGPGDGGARRRSEAVTGAAPRWPGRDGPGGGRGGTAAEARSARSSVRGGASADGSSSEPARATPVTPSAATWWTTITTANRCPGSPSTTSARHSGRSSGSGRTIRFAAQSGSSDPGGRVAASMCRSGSNAGSGAHTGSPSPGRVQTTRRPSAGTTRARTASSRRIRGTSSVASGRRNGAASNTPEEGDLEGRVVVAHPGVHQLVHAQSGQRHEARSSLRLRVRQGLPPLPAPSNSADQWKMPGRGDRGHRCSTTSPPTRPGRTHELRVPDRPRAGAAVEGRPPGSPEAFFLKRGEGEHALLFTDLFTVLLSGDETQGQFGVFTSEAPRASSSRRTSTTTPTRPSTSSRARSASTSRTARAPRRRSCSSPATSATCRPASPTRTRSRSPPASSARRPAASSGSSSRWAPRSTGPPPSQPPFIPDFPRMQAAAQTHNMEFFRDFDWSGTQDAR